MFNKFFLVLFLTYQLINLSTYQLLAEEEIRYLEEEKAYFITLTRKAEPKKNLPTNVSVVTAEEIKKLGAQNAGEAIRNEVGICDVSKRGTLGFESTVRLRSGGDTAKQTLVILDGTMINNPSTGEVDLGEISVGNIKRIEIVRGPFSALYGANALGGVINIITEEATEEGKKTDIYCSYGNFATQIYHLNFGMKRDNLSNFFTVSRNISNGWRRNSNYKSYNFTGKIRYDFKNFGKFNFSGGYYKGELGQPGSNDTPLSEYDGEKERGTSTPNAFLETERIYGQLEHLHRWNENFEIKSKIYVRNNEKTDEDPDAPRKDYYGETIQGIEVQLNMPWNTIVGSDFCFNHFRLRDKINQIDKINKKTENKAIFVQQTLLYKSLTTILGLRYDHHSVYEGQLNPRLNLIYQALENLKFSLGFGRAFRAPTYEDLYRPYSFYGWLYFWEAEGNPDLKPEKAWGGDIGVEYKLSNYLSSKLSYFRSDIKDLIKWEAINPLDPKSKWIPSNVGEAYNQGIEIEFVNQITKEISQKINYTYIESKGKEGDEWKTLLYSPYNRLNYQISYNNDFGFGINLRARYMDECWDGSGKTGNRISNWTIFDGRISQRIKNLEFFVLVDNIFNEKYQTRHAFPLPGRTFSGGITVSL